MRVKGAVSKKTVFDQMLKAFPGSFMVSDKELRIPMTEYGEPIEIKVALTRAKDLLGSTAPKDNAGGVLDFSDPTPAVTTHSPYEMAPTPDEKRSVEKMLKALGLMDEVI